MLMVGQTGSPLSTSLRYFILFILFSLFFFVSCAWVALNFRLINGRGRLACQPLSFGVSKQLQQQQQQHLHTSSSCCFVIEEDSCRIETMARGRFLNAFDHVPVIVNVNVIVGAYSLFTRALRSEFRALVAHFLWPCLAANCPIIHSISNKKCSLSQTLKPPTSSSPSDESESWAADCGLFFISWHSTEVCSLTKKCRQTLLLK